MRGRKGRKEREREDVAIGGMGEGEARQGRAARRTESDGRVSRSMIIPTGRQGAAQLVKLADARHASRTGQEIAHCPGRQIACEPVPQSALAPPSLWQWNAQPNMHHVLLWTWCVYDSYTADARSSVKSETASDAGINSRIPRRSVDIWCFGNRKHASQ